MDNNIVGRITQEECREIRHIYERRNGLDELARTLSATDDQLYERVVSDMGATATRFQEWWNRMAEKYQWESREGYNWVVDFDTCDIKLMEDAQ